MRRANLTAGRSEWRSNLFSCVAAAESSLDRKRRGKKKKLSGKSAVSGQRLCTIGCKGLNKAAATGCGCCFPQGRVGGGVRKAKRKTPPSGRGGAWRARMNAPFRDEAAEPRQNGVMTQRGRERRGARLSQVEEVTHSSLLLLLLGLSPPPLSLPSFSQPSFCFFPVSVSAPAS